MSNEATGAPLECHACGNRVLVTKYSRAHTTVQWTEAIRCREVAMAETTPTNPLMTTCHAMRDSIEAAVRAGRIDVPEE